MEYCMWVKTTEFLLNRERKKWYGFFYLINSNVHTKEKINKGTITYNADEEQTSIETQIHFQKNILSNYFFSFQ